MKYYVDTCIWRDYWEDRTDGLRPLGEFAYRFLMKALENRDTVLYSELVIEELLKAHPMEIIEEMFDIVKSCLMKVEIRDEDMQLARTLDAPAKDALHAAIAISNDAVLVSRDNHLLYLAKRPEELF